MLSKFKQRTGCNNEEIAQRFIDDAEAIILLETNRVKLVKQLEQAVIELAIAMYNRSGTEGEVSRSEGGISITYEDFPFIVKRAIGMFRLARVSGHAFEKSETSDSTQDS